MTILDTLGIGGALVMSAGFLFVRRPLAAFNAVCAIVVVGCGMVAWDRARSTHPEEALLLVAGFILFWLGLLIVRIMLRRSVSIRLLESYREAGGHEPDVREGIRSRLQDAERCRLVRHSSDMYRLTWFGYLVASLLRVVYRVTKVGE
jgi:uncharacterized membrane protein